MSVYGTDFQLLRCTKFRHSREHCGHAAGPAGAQVRGLMTHLCHKPAAEGAEIPQCSISGSPHRLGLFCPDSAPWRREGQMRLRRREFISGLGGAAAWPLAAGAQGRKRLGVLMGKVATERWQSLLTIFRQEMGKRGWIEGENLETQVRWNAADPTLTQAYATDLVGLFKPDVLLSESSVILATLQRATSTIPIVFLSVSDPVEQGFVPNLPHPGGNITGFANAEFSIAGKWADLIKQMAPSITRVAYIFDTEVPNRLFLRAIEAAAPSLGIGVMAEPVRSTAEIETALARVVREPNIGLIFSGAFLSLRAKLIVETVARYRLPAIYGGVDEIFMAEGGLMQYGNDISEQYRLAPFYFDRILNGTKPGDLAVHLPTKFKFIINRNTASALGIEVPLGLLLARRRDHRMNRRGSFSGFFLQFLQWV